MKHDPQCSAQRLIKKKCVTLLLLECKISVCSQGAIYILLWSFSHSLERVVALDSVCVNQCIILKWHLNSQPLLLHPCCTKQCTVFHLHGKIIYHAISTSIILFFGEKPMLWLTCTWELWCLSCQHALVLESKGYSWHVQQSWISSGSM